MNRTNDKSDNKYVVYNNTSFGDKDDEKYDFTNFGYGKNNVKVLYIKREGRLHSIRECEVDIRLRLSSKEDYLSGDNSHIIATDSQKNTVYVLARKYGVASPEHFATLLCQHFIMNYNHVEEAKVAVEDYPWQRLEALNRPHNHAFVMVPSITRNCTVTLARNGVPHVVSGLSDLRVLKTTQSAFKDFVSDDFRTLPDAADRIFSTIIKASWDYNTSKNVNYDKIWTTVKDCIFEKYAGPPNEGIYSPSVQHTLYLCETQVLDRLKEVASIEMSMPNKHYFPVDFGKFPKQLVGEGENDTVFIPVDKPFGFITAGLARLEKSKV